MPAAPGDREHGGLAHDTFTASSPPNAAPDYCEPVIAWRFWYAVEHDGEAQLTSVYYPVEWPKRTALAAACDRPRFPFFRLHGAPAKPCRCGIYAARPDALRALIEDDPLQPATPTVIGRVALWGRVVECERGWRASRAYPERLFVTSRGGTRERLARIAGGLRGYGVPVAALAASTAAGAIDEITSIASGLGLPIVDALP
jgi:hypothetical protein